MIHGFQYQIECGFEYHTNLDVQDDCIKIYHRCRKNNEDVLMPVEFYSMSSYDPIEPATFRKFVLQMISKQNKEHAKAYANSI